MVTATLPEINSISFMDDLGFLASGNLIEKVIPSLEITGKTVLR